MFKTILEHNYDKELQENAKQYILKERKSYEDICIFILTFAKEHNMLISNIDLLLDKQDYWNLIDIYTLNVDELSKELVSKLCKEFDKIFLLKIFEAEKEYYIEYNLRRLCSLNAIKPYKTFTLYDFISPVQFILHYNKNEITLYLLPYLIEIINLYKVLYDPALSSTWESVYEDIKKIEIHVDKEIETLSTKSKENLALELSSSKQIENVQNGGDDKTKIDITQNKCKSNRNKKILDIKQLVKDFIKDGHYILIEEENNDSIIQMLSSNIEIDHKLLVNFLSKFIEYGISYKKKNIYLPKESQLEKYNFYLEIPCVKSLTKKHFLTIYNNTSYELINYYEKNGFKYADPIVQLRFKYLSIWSNVIMQKTHGLHYDEFIKFMTIQKNNIKELRKRIDLYEIKKNYMGTYISQGLSKKMLIANNKNFVKSSYYCHDL